MAKESATQVRVVDVYPYRRHGDGWQYLLLKRSEGRKYAGAWRMVGGKIQDGESAWAAALRETVEELGRTPSRFWALPSVNAFYEWQDDRVNIIPAFAAEMQGMIDLNDEHEAFRWVDVTEAQELLFWPEQQRLLTLTDRLLSEEIPEELVIPRENWPYEDVGDQ